MVEGQVQPPQSLHGEASEATFTEFGNGQVEQKAVLVEEKKSPLKLEETKLTLERPDEQKYIDKALVDSRTAENSRESVNDVPINLINDSNNISSNPTDILDLQAASINSKSRTELMNQLALRANKEENENRKRTSDHVQKKSESLGRKLVKRSSMDKKSSREISQGGSDVNDECVAESSAHSRPKTDKPSEEEIKKIYNDLWAGVGLSYDRSTLILNYSHIKDIENKKIEKLRKERDNLRKKWEENQRVNNNEEKPKKDRYSRNQNSSRKSGRLSKNDHVNSERFSKNDYVNSEAAVEEIAKQIEKLHEQQRRAAEIPPMIIGEKNRNYAKFIDNNYLVRDPIVFYGFNKDLGKEWTEEEHSIFMKYFKLNPKRFEEIARHLEKKKRIDCHNYYYYLKSKKVEIYKELKKASSSNKGGGKSKEDCGGKIGKSVNRNILATTNPAKGTTRKTRSKSIVSGVQQKTVDIVDFLPEHQTSEESSHVKVATSTASLVDTRQNEDISEIRKNKDLSCTNGVVKTEAEDFVTSPQTASPQVSIESSPTNLKEVIIPGSSSMQAFQESALRTTNDVDEAAHALTLLSRQHITEGDVPCTSQKEKPIIKGKSRTKQCESSTRIERPSRNSMHSTDDLNIPRRKGTSSYWNKSDVEKFNNSFTQYGTDFKKISEILETKSEIQVKNYYEKQMSSGTLQKTVESRTENQVHVDPSPVPVAQPAVKPIGQSSDIKLESPTFLGQNLSTGVYGSGRLSDTPVPIDPPKPSYTRPSSSISHLLNPPTDENVSNFQNWFNDSNCVDQPQENPMVIDLEAEDEPEPGLSESKSAAKPRPSPIQFNPAGHSQRQQTISNTPGHQQQQNMPRTNIASQLHPTQSWQNTQQAQMNAFLLQPMSMQAGSLPQVPQQRLCYTTNPQQPSHQSQQHVIPQPQAPNSMLQNTSTSMLYPANPQIYSAVQHEYNPPRFGLLVATDSQANVNGQQAGGSSHHSNPHGDSNAVKTMPQIPQYPQRRNLTNMETPRGTYSTMQTSPTSFHPRPFENYGNAPAIIAPTTPPENTQARSSNYRVRSSDQHQVDRNQNSGSPA
ncbi:4829_t:CDS:2 [Acaulospora colombiana]|uniref:4829_t:CDS:1 n=1 Tax=Acaulospora colombiana TaxID=27376 RepID=A0ACA9KU25_9GLOM|nr:4829_t:CDS:2 [Acaulospora colombiana]